MGTNGALLRCGIWSRPRQHNFQLCNSDVGLPLTKPMPMNRSNHDDAGHISGERWISGGEAIAGSLIVAGCNVWHVLPNSVALLFAMGLISFRLREGSLTAMGLGLPKSWPRTALMAVATAVVQQAVGQFVVDPLTHPFLRYSASANPLESVHGHRVLALRWLGILWTYAAFGEEIGYRGYLLNRVADLGGRSRTALALGLLWSSIMFGCAHWSRAGRHRQQLCQRNSLWRRRPPGWAKSLGGSSRPWLQRFHRLAGCVSRTRQLGICQPGFHFVERHALVLRWNARCSLWLQQDRTV